MPPKKKITETPVQEPIQEEIKPEPASEPIDIPQTKEHIERKYSPEKLEKKARKYDPVKSKIYREKYKTKLNQRIQSGDEKALQILEHKKQSLAKLKGISVDAMNEQKKLKEEKAKFEAEKLESQKKVLEDADAKIEAVKKLSVNPPQLPNLVPKEKYKKLKAKVILIENELNKVKGATQPKYKQDVYNQLFGNRN